MMNRERIQDFERAGGSRYEMLKSGHSEILIMTFVSIGALYCVFLKHEKRFQRNILS